MQDIRCPKCNRKAGETDNDSHVKIQCQRCFTDFTLTKGVYRILPPSDEKTKKKQQRYEAKKKMSEASYQSRLGIRRK